MKNSVVASVEFYFKGERFAPSLEIDLDRLMQQEGGVERLHQAIAMAIRPSGLRISLSTSR